MMDELWVKKFRVLTFSLIFSGALNIGLIATLIAFQTESSSLEKKLSGVNRKGELEQKISNPSVIHSMSKLSFRELVTLLTNREMIEEGYTKRDLAVSTLVAFHHFNLSKALSTENFQKRIISLDETKQIELFPGLSDDQFDAIIRFAYQEKYPITTQGLFSLIKRASLPREESLEQAFFLTPEFYALQLLFQKTEAQQEPSVLLKLVSEGSWELLDSFAKEQGQMLELSVEKRRRLLLSYLAQRSQTAAEILLKTDLSFALKRLDDRGILDSLALLTHKTEEAEQFCIALLQSPRSDVVWKGALEKLYAFAGEALPEPFDLRAAAARFATHKQVSEEPKTLVAQAAPKVAARRFHTVQDGESLWRISRQYKVKVEEIVKLNGIEKDRLYPGMTIQIPD